MANPISIFEVSGRAMAAQLTRLNTTASNMANARSVARSEAEAFRALKPVFRTHVDSPDMSTVDVELIIQSDTQPKRRHDPTNPMADPEGYVWEAGVDEATEMIEMIEAARQYQNNVQVLQTAKSLILETIRMGK
ncbi:flagellar basal body rod protein FlgC [Parasphingorhabdus cellanae]|uniref:Flagellar basal-body rod protein FlgC n=1 Tax=Parasphingorhabdus cellanae TaxID=2806553 RepID=A0ABX7T6F5_9SPHN|nr:flagellar basal body rod protein FlgC [Parasphingorhabdus cellanae]QTD56493.1 flagellar basal body rod protein FlgC [Parasphingorhabdus cellanae]